MDYKKMTLELLDGVTDGWIWMMIYRYARHAMKAAGISEKKGE